MTGHAILELPVRPTVLWIFLRADSFSCATVSKVVGPGGPYNVVTVSPFAAAPQSMSGVFVNDDWVHAISGRKSRA